MENLNKESKPYKCGEYDDMFKAAEIASMAAEDVVTYKNSLLYEMEREAEIEYAIREDMKEGMEKGMEKGREVGREEGREEGKIEIARQMKRNGMSLGDILLYTGLSEDQLSRL